MYTPTAWVWSTAPCLSADNFNHLETQYDSIITIGEIKMWASSTLPDDYLACDGASVAVATYPSLYAVLGNIYGGTTVSFKVPDLRQRFVAGYSANLYEYSVIGTTLGSSGVLLSLPVIPVHSHTLNTGVFSASTIVGYHQSTICQAAVAYGETEYSTTATEHENNPPYVTLNYIIRYR